MSADVRFVIPPPADVPDDVRFYYRHARRSQEPVVELGAAGGRYCLVLASQEIRVIGVDADAEEMTALEQFARARGYPLTAISAPWTEFTPERRVGMVYVPAARLTALLTFEEQMTFLRHVRQHLHIGGKLAFDLPVLRLEELIASQPEALHLYHTRQDPSTGQITYVWERRELDVVHQVATVHHIYEDVDPGGHTISRRHVTRKRAFFWPHQVRAMLEAAGYYIEAVFGGFNDEPLTPESRVHVWVARRPLD
ncbi:MAG: class I SAM-dependent methyltransferase [Ardenticatenia bacterium]|nr:class I SAM-dependent methyltransferase [Ardenticatenia bacterium]